MNNDVNVPIFEFNKDGSIKPNPLFHRSWDKLHSRCIEYPFAASQLGISKIILDVGTAQSDLVWVKWLDNLPVEVYATDFDKMNIPQKNIKFFQSDVRKLPFEDNFFDKILAVSVIEHIGLEDSQTAERVPFVSNKGDLEAIIEIKRILKPGGELIMTFPFSKASFIFQNSARVYSQKDLIEINKILTNEQIDYYEYQHFGYENLYQEYVKEFEENKVNIFSIFSRKLLKNKRENILMKKASFLPEHYGGVTWRRIPLENVKAMHDRHIDGVLCGKWKKQ